MTQAVPMILYNRVKSTQDIAKRYRRSKVLHVAHQQTSGRGRSGGWVSPAGCGLYMSIAIPGVFPPKPFMKVVLHIVAQAIRHETCLAVRVKRSAYGNDIYFGKKKVAGIIAEVSCNRTVVGVGINIKPHKSTMDFEHICEDAIVDRVVMELIYTLAQTIGHELLLAYDFPV